MIVTVEAGLFWLQRGVYKYCFHLSFVDDTFWVVSKVGIFYYIIQIHLVYLDGGVSPKV